MISTDGRSAMHSKFWAFIVLLVALASAPGLAITGAYSAAPSALRSPYGGDVRALVIGIDAYRHVRPLKGAVADARDIESALRRSGVQDVTALIDAKADRASVLAAINGLLERTSPRDLILLTLAGHGAQEPERVRGTQPDGVENVFLLAGFEATAAGSQERILGAEFNHFIKQFESRGAHVLFVADTCFGGGMTRDLDPRAEEMSFRQVPSYRLSADLLKPVTTASDELLTEVDFDRTAFLAAVDRKTKAPEVEIPGIPGYRGALSYAVARAIEGNADSRGDGKTTLHELFGNVRQVVYQLSNERQNIVAVASPRQNLNTEVVFESVRSVSLEAPKPSAPVAAPTQVAQAIPPPAPPSAPAVDERPIKIASLDGNTAHFAGIKGQQAAFEVVPPVNHPDLIWDPTSHDVLAWGDVVAYGLDPSDLPSVIDRAMAIRELKLIAGKAPQTIKVAPDDSLHRNSSLVRVEIPDVAGRALILFNIAGDGTVQMLYPIGADPHVLQTASYSFPVRVQKPFGSDQLVAITSQQRMADLEQALQGLDKRRAAVQMITMIKRFAPADARIGSAGLFTAP
jgi:Caspase domain